MKNKLVTLSLILCIVGIFVLLNYPQKVHAIIFFSETWDTGTPPSGWPCKNFPNAITTAPFNGWTGRDFLVDNSPFDGGKLSGLSTSKYHSPPRSYYQNRPAGDYWTCDITKNFSQPYPTKIHLRFYVYFTNNWLGTDNPPLLKYNTGGHFIFTNSALSCTGFRIDIGDHVSGTYPYECNNNQAFPGMYFSIADQGCNDGGRGTAPYDCYNLYDHLEEWLCVEFMLDAANDRYNLWVNGDQKVNNASTPITQTNFTKIIISGFNGNADDFTGDFYLDDIVVADSYIGCNGGSDTQSPTVPAGLSAQAVSSSQINLSWTAATDNVGVTGYRVYRNGTQIATSPTNSYSNTGLSASTVYTYSVSAYDAANNVSAQSVSETATTAADTGGSNQNSGGNDASASGGSGCGFAKDDGKGQGAKGEGLSFILMLIITLCLLPIARRLFKAFNRPVL